MIGILVEDRFQALVSEGSLSKAAETALQVCGARDFPSLAIRVTNDSELQDLNLRYRGINRTTDVLAFGDDFEDPDLESRYLGDVVISYPQAEAQAMQRGHEPAEELQLLVIHGVLHLLGYDHASAAEKTEMWKLQDTVLAKLGLSIQVGDAGEA